MKLENHLSYQNQISKTTTNIISSSCNTRAPQLAQLESIPGREANPWTMFLGLKPSTRDAPSQRTPSRPYKPPKTPYPPVLCGPALRCSHRVSKNFPNLLFLFSLPTHKVCSDRLKKPKGIELKKLRNACYHRCIIPPN